MAAALSAKGGSVSGKGQNANVGRIFNEQDEELDADWDNLPEDVLCSAPVYERFAHFLLCVPDPRRCEERGQASRR